MTKENLWVFHNRLGTMMCFDKLKYFFLFSILTVWAAKSSAQVIDKIVAKVDNYIVLNSEIDKVYYQYLYDGAFEGLSEKEAKCKVLEDLIVQKMMAAKAEIDSVTVDERQVESQLQRRWQYLIGTIGNEKMVEKQFGKTKRDIIDELRDDIREQMVVSKMQSQIGQDVDKPTPKEVKRFFNEIPRDSVPQLSAEVEVSHIVKIPDVNREQKRKTREKLDKIRNEILQGADFSKMAQNHSEDFGSAQKGGDLGWTQRGAMVPAFEAAALRTKPGDLSRIVESKFGFHLILLHERRGDEYHASHILLRPESAEVDKLYASQILDSLRRVILHDSISFEQAARLYSDDENTNVNGGSLISQVSGTSKIFLEDLDSYLFFVIDTMQVGNITPPVKFRTADGRDAVRLIYYKSRNAPHKASLDADYEKISNMAFNFKRNQAINQWFLTTKDELYIFIDKDFNYCNILGLQ